YFYTAYTKDGGGSDRPVTFFYNGGPGSPTIWLHMGSFAPVRVTTANPEYIRPAPYGFGPNPYSLIDKSDLVFIDMIGAGWSRPL
ncbi:peptidase S1, partial [Acinetobacter baumannii]